MAEQVLIDSSVTINNVDLSDRVKSVSLDYSVETHDNTAMGNTTRSKIAGFKNWTMTVDFMQDYAAAEVDATLFDLVGAAAFPVIVKPTSAAVAVDNPSFSGDVILENYQPLNASVGELGTVSVTFNSAGPLTRAIA